MNGCWNRLIVCSLLLILAQLQISNASAGTVELRQVYNSGDNDGLLNLAGTRTFDILLDCGPEERVVSQQIYFELTAGAFIHHPLGTITPPNATVISLYPAIAFDTFVASGTEVVNSSSTTTNLWGRSDEFGGPRGPVPLASENLFDVLWAPEFGQTVRGAQDFVSARITLTNNAKGTLSYQVAFGDGNISYVRIDVPITSVPEPATAVLLGFVGLISLSRARRSQRMS